MGRIQRPASRAPSPLGPGHQTRRYAGGSPAPTNWRQEGHHRDARQRTHQILPEQGRHGACAHRLGGPAEGGILFMSPVLRLPLSPRSPPRRALVLTTGARSPRPPEVAGSPFFFRNPGAPGGADGHPVAAEIRSPSPSLTVSRGRSVIGRGPERTTHARTGLRGPSDLFGPTVGPRSGAGAPASPGPKTPLRAARTLRD